MGRITAGWRRLPRWAKPAGAASATLFAGIATLAAPLAGETPPEIRVIAKTAYRPSVDERGTALADLGASYPDIIDFLRAAQESHCVSCPIVPFNFPEMTLKTLFQEGPALK